MSSIRHGDCEFGHWVSTGRRGSPALREYVLGCVGFEAALRLMHERHLPSGEAALVINLGAPYRLIDPDGTSFTSRTGSIAGMGLRDRYFVTDTPTGEKNLMLIRLTPLGAHLVFGVPMSDVANRAFDLEDIRPRLARELSRRLDAALDWQTRFTIVEKLLAVCIAESRAGSSGISWAWQTLRAADGSCRISLISPELDLSHKQLIAQFKQKLGLPPKTVARLFRFNKVLKGFRHADQTGWASVAQECGYADQAHLIREFREFAGGTPTGIAGLAAGFTLRN